VPEGRKGSARSSAPTANQEEVYAVYTPEGHFKPIAPYNSNPVAGTLFFELVL